MRTHICGLTPQCRSSDREKAVVMNEPTSMSSLSIEECRRPVRDPRDVFPSRRRCLETYLGTDPPIEHGGDQDEDCEHRRSDDRSRLCALSTPLEQPLTSMVTNSSPADDTGRPERAIADKSMPVALLLALVLSPAAYYYVGRTKLAVINLLTLNYLLLGIVIVPIHVYTIITGARNEQGV